MQSLLKPVCSAREIWREFGLKATVGLASRKLISPVARVGSVYLMECDLRAGLPAIKPVQGIIARDSSRRATRLQLNCDVPRWNKPSGSCLCQGWRRGNTTDEIFLGTNGRFCASAGTPPRLTALNPIGTWFAYAQRRRLKCEPFDHQQFLLERCGAAKNC